MISRRILKHFVILSTVILFSGCSEDQGATVPVSFSSASISVAGFGVSKNEASILALSDMSFCVTQLKLIADGGTDVDSGDGDDLFESRIGLVDFGSGSTTVNWGDADLPVGVSISGVKVEIHQDAESCNGANYSVSYNGSTISQDVELTFMFDQALIIDEGASFVFDLSNIAAAFDSAKTAGAFSDGNITSYIENISDSAAGI